MRSNFQTSWSSVFRVFSLFLPAIVCHSSSVTEYTAPPLHRRSVC